MTAPCSHDMPRRSQSARCLAWLFRGWQRFGSPLFGPSCRFTPTCSSYGIEAVSCHGAIAGLWLSLYRIGRCHPLGGRGLDPVPDRFTLFPKASQK